MHFYMKYIYIFFEHYQLWMMDSKAQRVRNCYSFKIGRSFSTVSPKMGSVG